MVEVRAATTVSGLAAWPDPYRDVILRAEVVPTGVSTEEFSEHQRRAFAESLRIAAAIGMRKAGLPAHVDGDGARVIGLLPGAPAEGLLEAGDVVISADDEPVRLAADLVTAVGHVRLGDLTRGRGIAGTGTVDSSGRVGRISGLAEKVRGAQLAGAATFLAPDDQAEEARTAAPEEMTVIGIADVGDAIGALGAPDPGRRSS